MAGGEITGVEIERRADSIDGRPGAPGAAAPGEAFQPSAKIGRREFYGRDRVLRLSTQHFKRIAHSQDIIERQPVIAHRHARPRGLIGIGKQAGFGILHRLQAGNGGRNIQPIRHAAEAGGDLDGIAKMANAFAALAMAFAGKIVSIRPVALQDRLVLRSSALAQRLQLRAGLVAPSTPAKPQHPGRDASNDGHVRHVLADHGTCCNHSAPANIDPIDHHGIGTNPDIVPDGDAAGLVLLAVDGRVRIVIAMIEADE